MDTVRRRRRRRRRRRWRRREGQREGQRGKMFKEEEQNWIKKNVLWRREEVEEGNVQENV